MQLYVTSLEGKSLVRSASAALTWQGSCAFSQFRQCVIVTAEFVAVCCNTSYCLLCLQHVCVLCMNIGCNELNVTRFHSSYFFLPYEIFTQNNRFLNLGPSEYEAGCNHSAATFVEFTVSDERITPSVLFVD